MGNIHNTFKISTGGLDRLVKRTGKAIAKIDEITKQRITQATGMVWMIAHQRRPYINKAQVKAEGRSKRVSDPNAELGVPVDTGMLQSSIDQKVTKIKSLKYQGEVSATKVPYGLFIEFGTSKMQARPFMRPAITLTQDAIKRTFEARIDSKF